MPSLQDIRRRIRSVKSTAEITKAMEMVATSKMRRAQAMALASRPYAEKMRQVLGELARQTMGLEAIHPLLQQRERKKVALLLITTDRGLCGGLNSNLLRLAAGFILEGEQPVALVTVGRKGRDWMMRHGQTVIAEFTNLGDKPTYLDTIPMARVVSDGYMEGAFDEVHLMYSHFVSTMTQRPTTFQLLPVQPPVEEGPRYVEYIFEPDPLAVLAQLLPRFVEVQIYHAVLEGVASEQSARMVAMRNATENALEIVNELTLRYNKTRQESITKEISEIASGAEALA